MPEGSDSVIKAQVLSGGRGKGKFDNGFQGGVHIVTSSEDGKKLSKNMLGHTLITNQSGPDGKICEKVLVQERLYARKELYFAILLDRATDGPVLVGSKRGGMNIEDVARDTPEAICKIPVDITTGVTQKQLKFMSEQLGFDKPNMIKKVSDTINKLYNLFIEKDALLIEINPFVETPDSQIICSDCKLNFDDNTDFKHKDLFALKDTNQEDPREKRAQKLGLSYIGLDGNIGCIVNGAGLAMATMDIIKLYGGEPANFLDVGGGATQDQITEALKILNDDNKVQAILINIFGGIMRCDVIAKGIIEAAKNVTLRVPLVVRLQGTKSKEARILMDNSELKVIPAEDLDNAAFKAVRLASIVEIANDANIDVKFELPI